MSRNIERLLDIPSVPTIGPENIPGILGRAQFLTGQLEAVRGGRKTPESINQTQDTIIPPYLIEKDFATTIEDYFDGDNWSEKTAMFANISRIAGIVEDRYGMTIPFPKVTPLTHKLWEEWLKNGKEFPRKTEQSLKTLINNIIEVSANKKIVIRHLEDDGNNSEVGATSYPGITSADEAIDGINSQYQYLSQKPWNWQELDHQVEVSVGIYPHADPPEYEIRTKSNGSKELVSGQPPIGIVAATRQGGEQIEIRLVIGDNLAAQELHDNSDIYHYSFSDPNDIGIRSLMQSRPPTFGSRTHIIEDRNGKLIANIKLPIKMLNQPIRIGESEIIRTALFAAVAAQKLGHDVKVEAALNDRIFAEINSLTRYQPKERLLINEFEPSYITLPIINSIEDARLIDTIQADSIKLPPAIILSEELKNSTDISDPLEIIVRTIKEKIQDATNPETQSHWENALILATGTSQTHRLDPLLQLSKVKYYISEKLPSTIEGDILVIGEGRNREDIWIRNSNLSGDGTIVVSPEHWGKTFPQEEIGNKAYNARKVLSHNNLQIPEYIVLTNIAFQAILHENNILNDYYEIINGNGTTDISKTFKKIRENLQVIPDAIWKNIVELIERQIPNATNHHFIARSNSTVEDAGDLKRYAGSFATYDSLSLSPEQNTYNQSSDKPSTLASGILQVIASAFTPELANHLKRLPSIARKRALSNWTMPVKIDRQIGAIVSGVASAIDPDIGNIRAKDFLTVTAQTGIGGVVNGVKIDKPILTVKADRQTLKITSIKVKHLDQKSINLALDGSEIKDHFPEELTLDWIFAIMNASAKVERVSGKIGLEWALDHEPDQDPQLWFNQSR